MLCQICKQNSAVTFVQHRKGVRAEIIPICAECAVKFRRGEVYYLNDFEVPDFGEQPRCPVCQTTLDEILKTGRVGCANCYSFFEKQLRVPLTRIHGRTSYRGRVPAVVVGKEQIKTPVMQWKEQLKIAIQNEDYEQAVVLRDKIRNYQRQERAERMEREKHE